MYQALIRETLAKLGQIGRYDPRHVEGMMRLVYGTLDALGGAKWRRAVVEACEEIAACGVDVAEDNAKSYGL